MKWIKFKDKKPDIIIFEGRKTGHSEPVLTKSSNTEDDPIVQRFCRGGRGDLTTEYWSDSELVTHWAKITD